MTLNKVEVTGLKQFRKGLKQFAPDVAKQFSKANKAIATIVIERATSKAYSLGGVIAKTASSGGMKAVGSQTGVAVRLGSSKVPYALGAEFGGGSFGLATGRKTSRGGWTSQFPAYNRNQGNFLYPTIRASRDDIEGLFMEAIHEASKEAFPEGDVRSWWRQ